MTELIINIPDSKLPFLMLLARELDFVVVDQKKTAQKLSPTQKKWVENFKTSLHEVELHAQGKNKT
jgi:hypothetical protein